MIQLYYTSLQWANKASMIIKSCFISDFQIEMNTFEFGAQEE